MRPSGIVFWAFVIDIVLLVGVAVFAPSANGVALQTLSDAAKALVGALAATLVTEHSARKKK